MKHLAFVWIFGIIFLTGIVIIYLTISAPVEKSTVQSTPQLIMKDTFNYGEPITFELKSNKEFYYLEYYFSGSYTLSQFKDDTLIRINLKDRRTNCNYIEEEKIQPCSTITIIDPDFPQLHLTKNLSIKLPTMIPLDTKTFECKDYSEAIIEQLCIIINSPQKGRYKLEITYYNKSDIDILFKTKKINIIENVREGIYINHNEISYLENYTNTLSKDFTII